MSSLYVFVPRHSSAGSPVNRDCRRFEAYKRCNTVERIDSDWANVRILDTGRSPAPSISRDDFGNWMCSAGAWIHREGILPADQATLLTRFVESGAEAVAPQLEGVFALVYGDARSRTVTVVTDACGSMHMYSRASADGIALCTSSLALSEDAQLDPVAAHEYVATGIIYEDRSLWRSVRKLGPATITTHDLTSVRTSRYWRLEDMQAESLDVNQAADALHAQLVAALRNIGRGYGDAAADLTGGYDSRMLMCGLLDSGLSFTSTVSGAPESPDVLVARDIATRLGRPLLHSMPPAGISVERATRSMRLCDGEYDVFDFARILATHEGLSSRFRISLNGSFGELGRGYWWELLWPRLAAAEALDTSIVARRRFAALPYDSSVLVTSARFDLARHMAQVGERALANLRHLPNTSQMDALYFTLRMQRWQGRIASTTNQIWPAVSPLGFPSVLAPILSARANTRFRSLLARTLFERHNELLASIPLEHGYPPRPARLANLLQFWPLVPHYAGKVRAKLASRLSSSAQPDSVPPSATQRFPDLFGTLPLGDWLSNPRLPETGIFEAASTRHMLDPTKPIAGPRLDQWQRMVSLEWSLRRMMKRAWLSNPRHRAASKSQPAWVEPQSAWRFTPSVLAAGRSSVFAASPSAVAASPGLARAAAAGGASLHLPALTSLFFSPEG